MVLILTPISGSFIELSGTNSGHFSVQDWASITTCSPKTLGVKSLKGFTLVWVEIPCISLKVPLK